MGSAFKFIDKEIFALLFKSRVRPILEYGNTIWSPRLKKDIDAIERVQRRRRCRVWLSAGSICHSIYRSIAMLVNVRYRYLMVSRYFDISNDQTILGRYIVRSGVSSHSILKQPSIWKHCPKTSISRYLLLIVRLSIRQTSILLSSIAKRFLVILKYRRTESIVHLPSNS